MVRDWLHLLIYELTVLGFVIEERPFTHFHSTCDSQRRRVVNLPRLLNFFVFLNLRIPLSLVYLED